MTVHDPLYGRFEIPRALGRLVLTPEVRRLSQVRLLNSLSPSIAALSEVRRYSHTLGVLYLSTKCRLHNFSDDERCALGASVLLHDIGTPPFGHLVEYHLRDLFGWTHEKIIHAILWGDHVPENRGHQIFAHSTLEFRRLLKDEGISLHLVDAIITGRHPLGALLFGSIDLDNLDNVARMAWGLGLSDSADFARELATELDVDLAGCLLLSQTSSAIPLLRWATLRDLVYNTLMFDPLSVASQAVLSDAVRVALEGQHISEHDWVLSDEQLLERLLSFEPTKADVSREYLGRPPQLAFCLHCAPSGPYADQSNRSLLKTLIEESLRAYFPRARVLGYAYFDQGTFSKSLTFLDPSTLTTWSHGSTSSSVIIYGFLRGSQHPDELHCIRAANALLAQLNVAPEALFKYLIGPSAISTHAHYSLNFSA